MQYEILCMQIMGEGLYNVWVTSGQTKNSSGLPIPELQSQPILPASAVVTLQWSQAPKPGWSFIPKHSLSQGATTYPHSGVVKAREKKIELINTPWLPSTPSQGTSTIYEPTVLTQGKASQQYSFCPTIPKAFPSWLPCLHTGGHVAPQG